jgi:transposase-like protein
MSGYVYLDATHLMGLLGKAQQVCSRAVVVAMGVNEDGRREFLGLKVGDSEGETLHSGRSSTAARKARPTPTSRSKASLASSW